MDLTPQLPQLRRTHQQVLDLFAGDRVVLALGSRALLSTIASQLPPEQLVGAATTARSILQVVERETPDLLILSDPLEDGSGLALVTTLKERWPRLRILLLVMGDPGAERLHNCVKALRAGVAVVSDRLIGSGTVMAAVQSLSVGARFFDSALTSPARTLPPLSEREKDVMRWQVAGLSNGEIAAQLQISPETVKSHLHNVFQKLGVRNRQQAALLVLQLGLLDS
ncbi:MAG: response regulator transcription factor [Cyanobacteriota bacterium]|nr:response regulator transcription factor [Cyanobacteriota bacterium]